MKTGLMLKVLKLYWKYFVSFKEHQQKVLYSCFSLSLGYKDWFICSSKMLVLRPSSGLAPWNNSSSILSSVFNGKRFLAVQGAPHWQPPPAGAAGADGMRGNGEAKPPCPLVLMSLWRKYRKFLVSHFDFISHSAAQYRCGFSKPSDMFG